MILCNKCKEKPIAAGSMITKYICPQCFEQKLSESTYTPKLCPVCANKYSRCQRCVEEIH